MKLVASMLVRNELGRFLEPCVEHLLEFVDEIAVLDNGSTDGSLDFLEREPRVRLLPAGEESEFFQHEGNTRNALLDWTLDQEPTHVLSIDADEFVADGAALRARLETDPRVGAWMLEILEVWKAFPECLCVREDGGWRPHPIPILYAVPSVMTPDFRIRDAALACGREPTSVRRLAQLRQAPDVGTEILHFGWANEATRAARHRRYAIADGGRFHASSHLASILFPDEEVHMDGRDWPEGLSPWRDRILERTGGRE